MADGYLADRNEVADCTITSNVSWLTSSPLDAMKTTPLIDVAESTSIGTVESPVVIEMAWTTARYINYAGLQHTNLRQESYRRCEVFSDTEKTDLLYTSVNAAGKDKRVVPGIYDPATLRPGSSNWLRGGLDARDFRLYPTNIHEVIPLCRARVIRWTLWGAAYEPDDSDATSYRIGLAWASDGQTFARHVGSTGEGTRSNDELIETPGGSVWVEPGTAKRFATIDRAVTDKDLRDALFDMAHRAGRNKPLIWLPNTTAADDCFRYGGLFRRADDHQHKYMAPFYTNGTIELEEWTE